MPTASSRPLPAEPVDEALAFIGGRRCLDFTATLRKRHAQPVETLTDGAALARWLVAAGLLPSQEVALRPADLDQARALREAVWRAVTRAMAGRAPAPADVDQINRLAARADLAPQLARASARAGAGAAAAPLRQAWGDTPTVEAALSTIARDAVALLSTEALARVKPCGNPKCSLLFQDDSQGRRRTWCSMERCGNRFKIAGYRSRIKEAAAGAR